MMEEHQPDLRWVPAKNLHFTLRFLGELPEGDVRKVGDAVVEAVAPLPAFTLRWGGFGVFPSWRRPRVLWVGCRGGGPALTGLARAVNAALDREGFTPADKPFVPHLTVGRWRRGSEAPSPALRDACEGATATGVFPVNRVAVVESRLERSGARYQLRAEAPLA